MAHQGAGCPKNVFRPTMGSGYGPGFIHIQPNPSPKNLCQSGPDWQDLNKVVFPFLTKKRIWIILFIINITNMSQNLNALSRYLYFATPLISFPRCDSSQALKRPSLPLILICQLASASAPPDVFIFCQLNHFVSLDHICSLSSLEPLQNHKSNDKEDKNGSKNKPASICMKHNQRLSCRHYQGAPALFLLRHCLGTQPEFQNVKILSKLVKVVGTQKMELSQRQMKQKKTSHKFLPFIFNRQIAQNLV